MAGTATVQIKTKISNLGDGVDKDHTYTVSNVAATLQRMQLLSKQQSVTINLSAVISNCMGIFVRNVSATGTETLFTEFPGGAGAGSANFTMRVPESEAVYVRPATKALSDIRFANLTSGTILYEFVAFGGG